MGKLRDTHIALFIHAPTHVLDDSDTSIVANSSVTAHSEPPPVQRLLDDDLEEDLIDRRRYTLLLATLRTSVMSSTSQPRSHLDPKVKAHILLYPN
ncbi:hypothetical protein C0989_002136 [Termitomyces sp. Mn162]|nr:hypothetical protein C0989_002136 [Termitomyces sp. Mn162]